MSHESVDDLSDRDLLAEVKCAVVSERRSTVALVTLLAELDVRRLYLGEGCSSLFTYCTSVLHLSEHAAYRRIAAARASRRFPVILGRLESGLITLTTVLLLAPHLTSENDESLLDGAAHKAKPAVEHMIACLHRQPDIESTVRRAAGRRSGGPSSTILVQTTLHATAIQTSPGAATLLETQTDTGTPLVIASAPRAVVSPLAPERYLIKVTVSREAHGHLRRAQDLMRHVMPTGDPAMVIERALAVLVEQLERTKVARVKKPAGARVVAKSVAPASAAAPAGGVAEVAATDTPSRHIPASVRRAVWHRDGGRCAFVGTEGRCAETGFLEFHHVEPFADGGLATVQNLSLRCRAHNAHESGLHFGKVARDDSLQSDCVSFKSMKG